ncbi:hypothetical protein MRX96_035759 [Rhipicephalus microplus]
MLPTTVTYRTVAAFTFGLPLLLFVLVVVISYIYIASPCQDPPEWRECVPMLAVSLYYFDPKSADCLPRDTLPKGCLNGSNGFEDLQQCQQACAIHLPPKRCRTVTLDECDATALKPSVVYDPATDTCASWQYSKGCYQEQEHLLHPR